MLSKDTEKHIKKQINKLKRVYYQRAKEEHKKSVKKIKLVD